MKKETREYNLVENKLTAFLPTIEFGISEKIVEILINVQSVQGV
jgi:hypothetical protein